MKRAVGCLFPLVVICIIGYIIYEKREEIKDSIETFFRQPNEKPELEREAKPSEKEIITEYDFSLTSINGKTYSLSDLKGKVVLIDFWATWCPPCRRAIPYLCELYETYRDAGLVVLGISCDQEMEDLREFLSENRSSYPILLADEDVLKRFEITAIPALILFNQQGKLVHKEVGYTEEKMAELRKMIEQLLSCDVQVNYFGQIIGYKRISGVGDLNLQEPDECYNTSYSQISDKFLSSLYSTFDKLNIADNPFAQLLFLIELFSSFTSSEGSGYYSIIEILSHGISNTLSNAIATVAIMRKIGWDINCFYNNEECYLGINFSKDWRITKGTFIFNNGEKYILKEFDTYTPAGELKSDKISRKYQLLHVQESGTNPIPIVRNLPEISGETIDITLHWQYIDEEYKIGLSIPEEQLHFVDNLPPSLFGMAFCGISELKSLGIVERLRHITEEKSEYDQVNCLLKLCQSEDIFSYDSGMDIRSISRQFVDGRNDCDGRSVFLYSLLTSVLDYAPSDVVFLHWPFHMALGLKPKTAEAESTLMARGGCRFAEYYVLDPTYTGDTYWGDKMPDLPDECEVIRCRAIVAASE